MLKHVKPYPFALFIMHVPLISLYDQSVNKVYVLFSSVYLNDQTIVERLEALKVYDIEGCSAYCVVLGT